MYRGRAVVRHLLLSHKLNAATPSYGGQERFAMTRSSDIKVGDVATNSRIETGVHVGTHVDLPAHFHASGQTISSFPVDFWFFSNPLVLVVEPQRPVIRDEIIERLNQLDTADNDILLVKTGMGQFRETESYWRENTGFHPDVSDAIRARLPLVRMFGFDSISVSSFTDRTTGREAHRRFLDPGAPILLLEDMDLSEVNEATLFKQIAVAPLFIESCEALPCTVYGVTLD